MKQALLILLSIFILSPLKAQNRAEVLLKTTEGDIRIALYNETPQHRDNFLKLTRMHFYDSLLFHRIISDFMIQTGNPRTRNAQSAQQFSAEEFDYTIEPEFRVPEIIHRRGSVAAAREGDKKNPEMRSSATQFYIVWDHAKHLNGKYTVFGEVVEGLNVVNSIRQKPTDSFNKPLGDVRILSATVLSEPTE
jgi:peptidyl-prolyl cis-trans isomerase B (cyclophilin B)